MLETLPIKDILLSVLGTLSAYLIWRVQYCFECREFKFHCVVIYGLT